MAVSHHTRSNSFPNRSHPFASEVDKNLSRLKSSQSASTSEMNGLQDLYASVDRMLQLPLVQQALSQGNQKQCVNVLMNGSLRILEICSVSQNALLQSKEFVQELQSVLRRRSGDETELTSEISKYLPSRKVVKKAIHKAFGNLKEKENKSSSLINEEHVSMLKEVEVVTFTSFESLLYVISGPKLKGLSLISKLMRPRRIACDREETQEVNEFVKVDSALSTLVNTHKASKSDNIFLPQEQLKELEYSIQDLEEDLESMSRRLIKARISLLNILNN